MKARAFSPADAATWDGFVSAQPQATILHERRFLAYHGDRFADLSLIIEDAEQRIIGVFPAARDPDDPSVVISHPGATYGGVMCGLKETPERVQHMIEAVSGFYRDNGFARLLWKHPPGHLAPQRQAVMEWALWTTGAELVRRELWNLVELSVSERRSKGHKWATKRAGEAGLSVDNARADAEVAAFHDLLAENLRARHQTAPVHSAAELSDLLVRLGDDAELVLCRAASGHLVAGVLLFHVTATATHTQYICCNDEGREVFALNHLIEHIIQASRDAGRKTLSFGASTEQGGAVINSGLFSFKAGFGRSSATLDVYALSLIEESRMSDSIMRRGRPMMRDD